MMMNKINFIRIGYHTLFWAMFLIYRLTSSMTTKSLIGEYWWGDWSIIHVLVVEIIFKALLAYGVLYIIVPRFLDTKKFVQFGVLTFLWLYAVVGLYIAVYFYHMEHVYTLYMWWDKENMSTMFLRLTNIGLLLSLFSNFLIPTIVLGAIQFYKKQMVLSKIEEEKNKMELRALKNQLNPHFLFNTLNNLYSYVVTGSPKAPDLIMRLSGILDYVLYKSQNSIVALSEEVNTIEDFIGIEKIRYGNRLNVAYKTEGNMSVPVSPLILLSMVENAFKHGACSGNNNAQIKVNIHEKNGIIQCDVWNTKSEYKGEINDAYKEGIGLSNIKRQLDLLYPDRSELIINDNETDFSISLTLNPKT